MSGDRIPPGYYTLETLPPLSEGAAAIIAVAGDEGEWRRPAASWRRALRTPVGQRPTDFGF